MIGYWGATLQIYSSFFYGFPDGTVDVAFRTNLVSLGEGPLACLASLNEKDRVLGCDTDTSVDFVR